uniref:Uncharacterized protein n=1 Tax=viral metagenome TaxID=1070528 RepID=A0A6H1ZZ48_9ZZZZ
MEHPEQYLLHGPMPEINRMKKNELKEECQMWRAVWTWIPNEVKYYVARTLRQKSWLGIGLTHLAVHYPFYLSLLPQADRTTNRHHAEKLQTVSRHPTVQRMGT